jgi:tetratricopeptide (TPR) repeat protein
MHTLRIRHSRAPGGGDLVAVDYDPGRGSTGFSSPVPFTFALAERDRARLRFYMEDFLGYPDQPARRIARQIEADMTGWGEEMFRQLFLSQRQAQRHYEQAARHLGELRIEVQAEHADAWAIPWEILRDPDLGWLAVQARSFVRLNAAVRREYEPPAESAHPVRVLYAICRPSGRADVPFQSIARPLLSAFAEHRERVQIDVLRPPTFDQLGKVLREAGEAGRPYHIVHFDGHGIFTDRPEDFTGEAHPRFFRDGEGGRGYLLFEDRGRKGNRRLVGGSELGKLLVVTQTPLIVLNACQSATARLEAEAPPEEVATQQSAEGGGDARAERRAASHSDAAAQGHARAEGGASAGADAANTRGGAAQGDAVRGGVRAAASGAMGETPDAEQRERAYGSLAHEIMDAGAGAVVAMQWTVYVDTAARFVGGFYERLARGTTTGEAASAARADLERNSRRESVLGPVEMEDWPVPVVYEAGTAPLFERRGQGALELHFREDAGAKDVGGDLPRPPAWGFVDRGEVAFALDRAFDTHNVVLLHAYAGAGKTAMAREFALWYHQTGGLDRRRYDPELEDDPAQPQRGVVLWSSFETYNPSLPFDVFGQVFGGLLERSRVAWGAITEAEKKKDVALHVLRQIPVLWVWDNVEPVAGFPAGSASAWSAAEQGFLAGLLADFAGTRCKLLLTSRRTEKEWLGDLPFRIPVPAMPMDQRIELAARIAARQQHRLSDLADLRPLLRFSGGNPLTLTVLVGEALRKGLCDEKEVEAFVADLRSGEAEFTDEESQGRSRSLGASLRYGFEHAFSGNERRQLALLHLFQGFVEVNALCLMGGPESEWCLPAVRGLDREAAIALLDRAAEVGLLSARGGGYYDIHPALPWFFQGLFEQHFGGGELAAKRAFVEAMGALGDYYHARYQLGNREIVGALRGEEANLLHARHLARKHGWPGRVVGTMQGLQVLYGHTGRRAEWRRLVEEVVPDFIDPGTELPQPERNEDWNVVTGYRIRLAEEERRWADAKRLIRLTIDQDRQRAAPAMSLAPSQLTDRLRNGLRTLAISIENLGHVQREQGQRECVEAYQESLALFERIGDRSASAVVAFNLGHVFKDLPALCDLDQAEKWYRRSLELIPTEDRLGRGKNLGQLGSLGYERFLRARAAGQPEVELLRYLNEALALYNQELHVLPSFAVDDLAVAHHQLGTINGDAGDLDRAVLHYRESVRLKEAAGNSYGAANTRFNVAVDLLKAGREREALEYARAALQGYEPYGEGAAAEIADSRGLIAQIENSLRAREA